MIQRPFSFIFFSSLLFFSASCQTDIQLSNGQIMNGIISSGEILNFTIQGIANYSMRIELAGEPGALTLQASPPMVLQPYVNESILTSNGVDINGLHASGSICPDVITDDLYSFLMESSSTGDQSYSIRVTFSDPVISEDLLFNGILCCTGSEYSASDYIVYTAGPGISSIVIAGNRISARDSDAPSVTGPDILVRRGSCPTGSDFPDRDYRFLPRDTGDFRYEITLTTIPNFQRGETYYIAPRRALSGSPEAGIEMIAFEICPNGECEVFVQTTNEDGEESKASSLVFRLGVAMLFLVVSLF